MPRGWAALPRSVRWLAGGIAAVVLALAVTWLLFVPTADWLAHHDVGSAAGSLHETALDNARGRLLTLGAGLFAAGALIFTARNFTVSRRTLEVTEQGQVTDRYTKAIEQLGSEKLDIRIGGIYALERIAHDSARDHPTVMEVLTAFIRENSRKPWPPPNPDGQVQERSTRPDVQAAAAVVARRDAQRDIRRINLSGADLTGERLSGAHLRNTNLSGANLSGANLRFADLSGADLRGAHLTDADFISADLSRAYLEGAHLSGANFSGVDLRGAHLSHADFNHAILASADFSSAFLIGTDLRFANLDYAKLARAILSDADLSGAHLADATWSAHHPAPEGWELDTDSGLLKPAGTDSDPAESDGS